MAKVWEVPLSEQSDAEQVNSILWRLAIAMGIDPGPRGVIVADPDEILAKAESALHRHFHLGQ